jgi:hypothetical protein
MGIILKLPPILGAAKQLLDVLHGVDQSFRG